jgi:hypothetical protein
MSWDIIAQDLPKDATTVEEIPDDFQPQPIGDRAHLIARIQHVVPHVDFTDPSWGIIEGDDWSIEVSTGKTELCHSIAFHVRGGDGAIGAVAAILNELKLRAIDCQSSEFFSAGPETLESFHAWRRYLDRVVDGNST